MEIQMSQQQVKESFGTIIFIGSSVKYKYDRETKKKTDEIEGNVLELASEKMGKTFSLLCADKAVNLIPFEPVDIINLIYAPYAKAVSNSYAELVEKFTCEKVTSVEKGGLK